MALGSPAGYAIGRFGGRAFVDKVGKYVLLTQRTWTGPKPGSPGGGEPVVLFGRFIPLLRSFVPSRPGLGEWRWESSWRTR